MLRWLEVVLVPVAVSSIWQQIIDFFSNLTYTGNWPARWHCGQWTDFHGWLYIISDLLIWASYFAIPVVLLRILVKRRDLPFSKVFWLFVCFILLCGLSHLLDAIIFWWPAYRLSALVRFVGAIVSLITVYSLAKVVPVVMSLKTARQLQEEIDQRKIAEENAQQRFLELDRVLEASLDIICTVNNRGEFDIVSKAVETVLGYSPDELSGKKFHEFVHPEDLAATLACERELFDGKPTLEFENRYRRKDGSWVYISWKSTISEDRKTAFCIARNVSDKKRQEHEQARLTLELQATIEKLREQDKTLEKVNEFKFLADSIPQIIWTAQPDGDFDYYNQHWYEYTGMTFEQTKGWGWGPVLHPEDLEVCLQNWKNSVATGQPFEVEYRFKRASDNTYKWHLGRAIPMRDEKGRIIKWFGSATDIDEYKRALDLERKINQYEDFNRIVAHNLRGPAGNIETLLGLMSVAKTDEDRDQYLNMLKKSSNALNTTLSELMQVLDIRFNKNIPFDVCNLQSIVDEIDVMLKGTIMSKQAQIITDFECKTIKFPHIYLKSIFYNMISNSLKYVAEDVHPTIEISCRMEGGKTILQFKDNGLGIDLKKHGSNMFKLNKVFHRGFDSKGVGLFMTKAQIETFGGTISVDSLPNEGTTFTVTL